MLQWGTIQIWRHLGTWKILPNPTLYPQTGLQIIGHIPFLTILISYHFAVSFSTILSAHVPLQLRNKISSSVLVQRLRSQDAHGGAAAAAAAHGAGLHHALPRRLRRRQEAVRPRAGRAGVAAPTEALPQVGIRLTLTNLPHNAWFWAPPSAVVTCTGVAKSVFLLLFTTSASTCLKNSHNLGPNFFPIPVVMGVQR